MPAAATEMPVNPSKPAISATIKNPSAQRNIFDLLRFSDSKWEVPSVGIGLRMVIRVSHAGHDSA